MRRAELADLVLFVFQVADKKEVDMERTCTNPFRELRRAARMSPGEFADAIGVNYPTLWQAERGRVAEPTTLLAALERAGFDVEELAERYRAWRLAAQQERRHQFSEHLAAARVGGAA